MGASHLPKGREKEGPLGSSLGPQLSKYLLPPRQPFFWPAIYGQKPTLKIKSAKIKILFEILNSHNLTKISEKYPSFLYMVEVDSPE